MDAKQENATLAEKEAHAELMRAHAELMRAQARKTNAEAERWERDNRSLK